MRHTCGDGGSLHTTGSELFFFPLTQKREVMWWPPHKHFPSLFSPHFSTTVCVCAALSFLSFPITHRSFPIYPHLCMYPDAKKLTMNQVHPKPCEVKKGAGFNKKNWLSLFPKYKHATQYNIGYILHTSTTYWHKSYLKLTKLANKCVVFLAS